MNDYIEKLNLNNMKCKYIISYLFLLFSAGLSAEQPTGDSLVLDFPDTNLGTLVRTAAKQTQAISAVTDGELSKNSTSNPLNALYGLLSGLEMMQRSGWESNPTLILRGNAAPLTIIDGFPRALETLNIAEIESVTVLKDGPAAALWGARGANGVIMVTTKRGHQNTRMQVEANYTVGMEFPINQPSFANGYEYAAALNEALYYDGLDLKYTHDELDAFKYGTNTDLYANTDWIKEGLRKHTLNNQLNVTMRGGGQRLRYFTMLSYKNDYGILNENYANYSERYTAQMRKYDLSLRMNIDVDITPFTLVQLSMQGSLRELKRPRTGESALFSGLYNTPSGAFPLRTSTGLWGSNSVLKDNPIARIADVGYYKVNPRMLQADLRIHQDLSMLTRGLSAEVAVAYDNKANYEETGSKNFKYQVNTPVLNAITGLYDTVSENYGDDSALTISDGNLSEQYIKSTLEAQVNYNRTFGLHGVNGGLLYRMDSETGLGRYNTYKRMSMIAMAGYNYRSTYYIDLLLNHYGTSVLPFDNRFRNYSSISAAWVLSNEKFMKGLPFINNLKLRASYGRSGWDLISYELDRQYYVADGYYYFGDASSTASASREDKLAIDSKMLNTEVSDKYNIGLDLQLFRKLNLTLDAFLDKRSDILVGGDALISSAIGIQVAQQNAGKQENKGFEVTLDWKENTKKDFSYHAGVNFSYVKTKLIENGEGYKPYGYLSTKRHSVGQVFGLEAIGYFRDEKDIALSPEQAFSEVRPGDIKYKDWNNDNIIDDNDKHAIGYSSTIPEIYYGINLGFEYKGFGIDALFQGVAHYSKLLNVNSVYWPMRNNLNISDWYLHDKIRWTEETKDIANVPRLTTLNNENNFQTSTQWLANGNFFKLRNLNIYYNLPQRWISKIRLEKCQIFARANNVFSLDHIDYLNCEDLRVTYPDMFSIYFGATIKF